MTTSLPEPAVHGLHAYTESQMKAYGAAEYARAIANAAKVCDAVTEFFQDSEWIHPLQIREVETAQTLSIGIRKLGETPRQQNKEFK